MRNRGNILDRLLPRLSPRFCLRFCLQFSLGLVLLSSCITGVRAAELTVDVDHPTRGETVRVRISGVDDPTQVELSAAYRPGSATEDVIPVGRFGADGSVAWTPAIAGLSRLSALGGDGTAVTTRDVAVRFDSSPPLGILILLVAGLLLFGGTTVMLRRALED